MSDLAALGNLLRLARDTVANPREGATTVLTFAPPRQALWLMFALVVVISILIGQVVSLLTVGAGDPAMQTSPVWLGLLQAVLLFIMVHAVHRIGAAFGGTGTFNEALLLVIWLQFILICVQMVQIVAILVLPMFAGLILLVALAMFFWLLVNFIAVLHGFTSLGQVFVMVVVSILAIVFVLTIVLGILGVEMPQAPA